ncbi:urea ABC transporter permease subunit UrtC [Thioalkalivibrio sulfidiphilus]|uniref:Urea ABC transporter, permease protein UrtC n=1 Tax=Thioalkalivibrio sulfidiphilus (strain HL-EbGR7) TaxID=396588 RepID=B8GQ36_THISH|nr:urea ABC transporter permease subunit UrtC [Thioalkalivibrio sulfidiphilus]ACL74183.1 urea ABC transporter, permease protein UrtC [Thioalkalivibrio sulfidiphilus HL-EbGr7]
MTNVLSLILGKRGLGGVLIMAALILVVLPTLMDIDQLNLAGRFLAFAFVAVGLVLSWGYGGVLSLGQGIFFGIGGYAMAMFLKLEASDPESTSIQTTPGIPDFMDWNQITSLPWFWEPFYSLTFTIIAILVLPALFAWIIGTAMFKRRVSGVYFAIITQAIVVILTILIIGQQGLTGGVNGITDLRTLKGWDIRTDEALFILYYVNAFLLIGAVLLGMWILSTKYGRILIAMRDREDRVRFSGYDVANFKVFVFCVAALLSGIGGAMFTLQVGFMSPSIIGIVPSIEFVIFAAVGGRLSLLGAVYGALIVSYLRTTVAEAYPQLWLFVIGGVFIAVVMFAPYGLAGLYNKYVKKHIDGVLSRFAKPKTAPTKASTESTEASQ